MDYQNELDHILDCTSQNGKKRISVCYRCNCRTRTYDLGHSRDHAHTKERRICLSVPPKSKKSLFTALHEIGHIEGYRADYTSGVTRAEAEHNATQWAIREMRENLHLSVPRKITNAYKSYVKEKIGRALRRGLKKVPTILNSYR